MTDCAQVRLTPERIETGVVIHARGCVPWLVIAKVPATPFDEEGWQMMETGGAEYRDAVTGDKLGNAAFTGRTARLVRRSVAHFHLPYEA